jgi:hypothetical protein
MENLQVLGLFVLAKLTLIFSNLELSKRSGTSNVARWIPALAGFVDKDEAP